jgi:hypothetical protein
MKRFRFTAGFSLAGLMLLGMTCSVLAGELVPFKGSLDGEFTSTGVFPLLTLEGSGTGMATHLGKFTYEFPHTVDFSGVPIMPPMGLGTYTFTAANGDMVIADFTGFSTPVEPGFVFVTEEATITGGTGRFAGASGQFTVLRLVDQLNGKTTGSFEGTISTGRAK